MQFQLSCRQENKNPTKKSNPCCLLVELSVDPCWRNWVPFTSAMGEALLSPPHIMTKDKKNKEQEGKCFRLNESFGGAAICQIRSRFSETLEVSSD